MGFLHPIFFDRKDELRNGWWALAYLPFACFAFIADHWVGAAVLAIAGLALLKLQARPLRELGLGPDGRWLRDFAFGILCGGGILALAALVSRGFGGFHWERNGEVSLGLMLKGAWLYFAVALYEELLFHGYLLRRAVDGLGLWPGLLLMGLLFAYSHWENPGITSEATLVWATLNICLAGLLLGLGYVRFRSLAWPIGAHLGWNWTQGDLLGFAVSGTTDTPGWWKAVLHPGHSAWLTGGVFGLEASLPCALICGAGVVALAVWKGRGPSADPSTDGASENPA